MSVQHPWELHPDLTRDRLVLLAGGIAAVRNDAVEAHEPARGDGPWGLGCRVHERTCYLVRRLADRHPWLRVIEGQRDHELRVTFLIGQVPVRFYRGESGRPSARALTRNDGERSCQQLAFPFGPDSVDQFWRLAVETDEEERVLRVVLIRTTEEGVVNYSWDVPIATSGGAVSPITEVRNPPVELPPARVRPRAPEAEEEDGTGE